MTRGWTWGVAAFLLMACGGTVSPREESLTTGSSAAGGSTGVGGTAPFGSGGGATAEDPCVFETVEELCGEQCPASPADLLDDCADAVSFTSTPTDCNGSVVIDSSGFVATSWFFDANGKLTGALFSMDVGMTCPDGHGSHQSAYGTVCAPEGAPTDACVPADGCSPAPLMCDANEYCPASSNDVLAAFCGSTSALSVTTSPTTCGGSLLLVETTGGELGYCFDREGRLVGSLSRPVETGVESPRGSECIADGLATYACSDAPPR